MARWSSRSIHSALALPLVAPLLLTISTGFGYRFARNVLQYERSSVQWLMSLHSMSIVWLGGVYPLLVAAAVLTAAVTGVPLSSIGTVWRRFRAGHRGDVLTGVIGLPDAFSLRFVHRTITACFLLPLVLTSLTGAVWTVQQYYLGHTRKQSSYLMDLHQGTQLTGSPVAYTAVLFVSTLVALASGYTLIPSAGKSSGGVGVAPAVPAFFKGATKQ